MKKLLALTALAALMIAPATRAADRTGFLLGARAAYAFPFGDAGGVPRFGTGTVAFDDLVDHAWPLWLELNYRFGPSLELGAYGQYAFTNGGTAFDNGSDIRAGLQLNYIFAPGGMFTPWFGIGGGYEWLKADRNFDIGNLRQTASSTIRGWDFMVQAGADLHAGDRFTLGPFVAMTFGQFGDLKISGLSSADTNIDDKAWHEWLQVGVRATFF
ncbi:MAG TPA: outer membrane beta-barrel protein [Anaeromyxobacteraceae bacterium]|nr:outer membrane beta-barrel protein [Anaeromyxobacteraceae bacterium]